MSVYDQEIIPATTSGLISDEFSAKGTISITAGELTGDEGVKLQYSHDGTTWQDMYLNGVLQEITADHSVLSAHGPMKLRCVKSATTNAVSVIIWKSEAEY